jgi:hypothetical protein
MRLLRHSLAVLAVLAVCCALGACGSDDNPAASGSDATVPSAPADSSAADAGADATQPPSGGGDVDCTALKDSLANMTVNWQLVIGLTNSPSTEWAQIPLGSLPKFGDQLAVITTGLGSDGDAADALSFMSGANDIVQRGLGGDSAAQADLVTYMGTDVAANVGKQIPIVTAYSNAGCD